MGGSSRLSFEVDKAKNRMQGLKMFKNRLYDIVLLHFLMPVMDGPDLARRGKITGLTFIKCVIIRL
jgi:DNA-binding response OmpR family regulator